MVREHNDRMLMAWTIANLSRADPKKFPKKPDALFARERRARAPQSGDQMLAMAKMITIALGGTVLPKNKVN